METTLERPPRTMMEVYELLPEGTLAELINNQIYMSPAPNTKHFITSKKISKALDKLIEETGLGYVFYAPYDVHLDQNQNAVQPDVFVVLSSNKGDVEPLGNFKGVPDLIVEILSMGNRSYDLVKKKELYERFGVNEYWIVDPDTKLALGFQWSEKGYVKISEEIGTVSSPLLKAAFAF